MTTGLKSVAVWSPKGGVGKSVLAVALALKLAEFRKTVLIDGNPDNPDVANLLQCQSSPNVTAWATGSDTADVEKLLVRHSNRLWVLPGPPRYVEADALKGPLMESILDACLRAKFSVVVDLGTTLRDSTVAALDRVDRVLVPVTLDLLSLAPLRRLQAELALMRLPESKFRVVVNRHTNTREITVEDIQALSRFPTEAVVPSAKELASAVNRGEVGIALGGNSPVGRVIAKLAGPFVGMELGERSRPQRKGLLGKVFG